RHHGGEHAHEDVAPTALGTGPGAHRRHGAGARPRPAGHGDGAGHVGPGCEHRHPAGADGAGALEHVEAVTEGADRVGWAGVGPASQPGWDEHNGPHDGEDQQQHSQAPRPTFATRGTYRDVIRTKWMLAWAQPRQPKVLRRLPTPFLLRAWTSTSNSDANSS